MRRMAVVLALAWFIAGVAVAHAQDYALFVRPEEVIVLPGAGVEFHAQLFSADGTPVIGVPITWSVEPEELGRITEDGFFIAGGGAKEGRVVATAEYGGITYVASAHVIVGSPPPPELIVKVKPEKAVVPPGGTQQYRVRVEDRAGQQVPYQLVRWEVRPRGLGFVDPAGIFHAGDKSKEGEIIAVVEVRGNTLEGRARIVVSPPAESVIRGVVTDESGTAIQGATVWAHRVGNVRWSKRAVTNEEGAYELGELIPGIYVLFAKAEGYVPEYYDDAKLLREATPVQVGLQDTLEGYDFALTLGAKIRGVVYDEGGNALSGARVVAQLVLKPDFKVHALSADDGSYVVEGLPTGTYWLFADKAGYEKEFYQEASSRDNAEMISVEAPNEISGYNFTLSLSSAITGQITDRTTGDPLEGAVVFALRVSAGGMQGAHFKKARTDENGSYTLEVPAGRYIVGALHENYSLMFYDGKSDPRNADLVNVEEGQHTTSIDIALPHLGTIAGTVREEGTGQPIAGARVTAIRLATWRFAWNWPVPNVPRELHDLFNREWLEARSFGVRFETTTDENGNYRFAGLPAGRYYVQASAEGYVPEFYDGVTRIEDATPVAVQDETETSGIDFELGHGGSISGLVYSEADGSPIARACVVLYGRGLGQVLRTRTAEDGTYQFTGLRPGTYFVAADAKGYRGEFYDDARSMREATPIEITGSEQITDINIGLEPREGDLGVIAGLVVDEDTGSPIEGAWVYARPVHAGRVRWAVTDADGQYEITGLPSGSYFVMAWARGYKGEFYDNVRKLRDATTVEVNAPESTTGIDFALKPRPRGPFRLAGRVLDASGQPIEGALITVEGGPVSGSSLPKSSGDLSAEQLLLTLESDSLITASVPTDGEGYFVVSDLPDGEYKVVVSLPGAGDVYYGGDDPTQAETIVLSETSPSSEIEMQLAVSTGASGSAEGSLPSRFELEQNYPNPFNPSTEIRYALPSEAHVTLTVFNLRGQVVRVLVNASQAAGYHSVSWDGRDQFGRDVASGVYVYRIVAEGRDGVRFERIRKMTLVR